MECRFKLAGLLRHMAVFGFVTGQFLIAQSLYAQGQTAVIALSGQVVPDSNRFYDTLYIPAINNSGDIVFNAGTRTTPAGPQTGFGVFRVNGSSGSAIILQNQTSLDGDGVYNFWHNPTVNDAGEVHVRANLANVSDPSFVNVGHYLFGPERNALIARTGIPAAGLGNTRLFGFEHAGSLSAGGEVAFAAVANEATTAYYGIFKGSGGNLSIVARSGDSLLNNSGTLRTIFRPMLNDNGQVVFRGTNTLGAGSQFGIYRAGPDGALAVVSQGQAAPDGNGIFGVNFREPIINNNGQVAFLARLDNTAGGSSDYSGIYKRDGNSLSLIVRSGNSDPSGTGKFGLIGDFKINDSGSVAFQAGVNDPATGFLDHQGIYRSDNGVLTTIARSGVNLPGLPNTLVNGFPELNESGVVAFTTGTSLGTSNTVYLGDGIDLIKAVGPQTVINGSNVVAIESNQSSQRSSWLNDFSQVGYRAQLSDGRHVIGLFTPDIQWRANGSGQWSERTNWTLGQAPGRVHDVFINPASSNVSVAGPASDTRVKRLEIGNANGFATLTLQSGVSLETINGLHVVEHGTLAGNGSIVGSVFSSGQISPGASAGLIGIDGSLVLAATNTLNIELGGTGFNDFDQLMVMHNLFLDGNLGLNLINDYQLRPGDQFLVIDVQGSATGTFLGLGEGAIIGTYNGVNLFITYQAGNGNGVGFFASSVPEPGTVMIFALLGLCGLMGRRRR